MFRSQLNTKSLSWLSVLALMLFFGTAHPIPTLAQGTSTNDWLSGRVSPSSTSLGDDDETDTEGGTRVTEVPAPGLEGVQLEPVPIDASVACDAQLLKGSRRFPNAVFLFPKPVIGVDSTGRRLFEILPQEGGSYLMRFSVFFPNIEKDFNPDGVINAPALRRCSLDEVRGAVAQAAGGDAAQSARVIANVPISSISVSIDGLEKSYTLAGGQATMLNYANTPHVVEFEFASRKELEHALTRIQGEIGLGIHVAMTFASRASNGGMTADIDLEQLSTNLSASLKGKVEIAAGELKSEISDALYEMGLSIETEDGASAAHDRLVEQLTRLVMKAARTGIGGDDCVDDDRDNYCDGDDEEDGPYGRRRFGSRPSPSSDDDDDDGDFDVEDGPMIKVKVALEILHTTGTYKFNYNNAGMSQAYVYRNSVYYNGDVLDPDIREIQIDAGERVTAGLGIDKDETITLAPAEIRRQQVNFTERVRYFTVDEFNQRRTELAFPDLANARQAVTARDSAQGSIASIQIGKGGGFFGGNKNRDYLVWGEVTRVPSSEGGMPVRIEPTRAAMETLEIYVTFDRLGTRRYKLSDFMTETPLWKGYYDEAGGRIIVTAKQRLGQMTLENEGAATSQEIDASWVFQEKHNVKTGAVETTKGKVVRKKIASESSGVRILIGYDIVDLSAGPTTQTTVSQQGFVDQLIPKNLLH